MYSSTCLGSGGFWLNWQAQVTRRTIQIAKRPHQQLQMIDMRWHEACTKNVFLLFKSSCKSRVSLAFQSSPSFQSNSDFAHNELLNSDPGTFWETAWPLHESTRPPSGRFWPSRPWWKWYLNGPSTPGAQSNNKQSTGLLSMWDNVGKTTKYLQSHTITKKGRGTFNAQVLSIFNTSPLRRDSGVVRREDCNAIITSVRPGIFGEWPKGVFRIWNQSSCGPPCH